MSRHDDEGERAPGLRGWKVWTLPRSVLATVLSVDAAAAALVAATALTSELSGRDVVRFGVLVVVGVLVAELTRYIEQMRRRLADTPHVNMSSVTILAVTLLTGPFLGAVAAAVLYAHLWRRAWRTAAGLTVYRATFNASGMIVSTSAAAGVAQLFGGHRVLDAVGPQSLIGFSLVIFSFWAANSVLVGLVISQADGERSIPRLLGRWGENALEIVTLCLGVLTAVLMEWRPWLAVFIVPLVYVLHRSASVQHLEVAATTDAKTGLLNMYTWRCLAESGLEKARRRGYPVALLMADLDFFKRVNDVHGHLVGDQVLLRVAEVIRRQVRLGDLVGRFGGEEFVIFLSDITIDGAVDVAERIRLAVSDPKAELRRDGDRAGQPPTVSVSVGVAGDQDGDQDLEDLLRVADLAVYRAKQHGRNYVVAARP
ncbi:GGDEF domain-containing protein [Amycolatopsis sp. NPDC047767]|uniref:GGDEF domain-containing protein n=1 Tax=Amycolatopsis sp. NPDC047767 TaxID=3156765 RepID=UPI003451463C